MTPTTTKEQENALVLNENISLLGMIADHTTPKIMAGGDTAYTLNGRDYKGAPIIVCELNRFNKEPDDERITDKQ